MTDSIWAKADLITPMAVRVAATLRVADHIVAGRRSAEAIAEATGTHAGTLGRVLRHLVTAGVLTDRAGEFGLTALGEQLRDDAGVRPWLDLDGAIGRADLCLVELRHTVRTGQPAYPVRFGASFWDDLAADRTLSDSFDAQMGHHVGTDNAGIAEVYDWGSLDRVVDVGGGNGSLLCSLLARHPRLHGTVLDLAGPASSAREALAAQGFADRADAVTGSFFDPIPPGADGYLLSFVLHDWHDDDARAILRRCAAAAGPHGKVFVIEGLGSDGESPSTEMDLRMLAYVNGKERGLAGYTGLAADAGLTRVAVHPATNASMIEFAARSHRP